MKNDIRINRRDFMKTTVALSAAATIPSALWSNTANAAMTPDQPLLDPSLVKKLLEAAMSRGAEFADVFAEDGISGRFKLDEKKIRSAKAGSSRGVGIRVIIGQKVGYAWCEGFDKKNLLETAQSAAFIAANKPGVIGAINKHTQVPSINKVKIIPGEIDASKRAELLFRGNETAYSADPRVSQVIGSYYDSDKIITIANTDGVFVTDRRLMQSLYFHVIAEGDGDRRTGFYGGGGRVGFEFYDKLSPEMIAREAARQATAQLGAQDAPVGEQTVILSNGWSGILLHEAIGHGLEADFIRKGTSLYTGKVGQKVASELCTVIDEGQILGRRGSLSVDDEGSVTQKKVLIENGVLKGYMFDRLNAKLMNEKTTGSGRRESFKHYVMPRMTNTYLAPGESDPADIIKSVKKGFYAKHFGGGQVDITNGNFVFEVAEGYLIENGEVTKPVKGATLIGVGPEVLKQVSMVGNDAELDPGIGTCGKNGQSVPVGVGLPHVRIENLTVGGTDRNMKRMV
jgi:TldD protein